MIGYRDMTFCRGDGCIAFDRCPRAITEKVKAAASRWWGGDDFPIVQFSDPKSLPCYEKPTNDTP